MRKLFAVLLFMLLMFGGGVTAFAESDVSYTENGNSTGDSDAVAVDWSEDSGGCQDSYAITAATAEIAATPEETSYPVDIETVIENGVVIIKKAYELPTGADPAVLSEDFERDGYSFTLRDILAEEQPGESLTRPAVKLAMASTTGDDKVEILAQFPASIDHEEDDYIGRLTLDPSSLVTEPEEYESYSYAYTETESLGPLERNDPALLAKELQGMTLAGISFEGRQESLVGDSLVPASYEAVVTWRGMATGKRPVSYVTTATYTGELTKIAPGSVLYTYIYTGTPIPQATESAAEELPAMAPTAAAIVEPTDASTASQRETPTQPAPIAAPVSQAERYILFTIALAFPIGTLVVLWFSTKKEREARRKNLEALEEIARFIRGEE